MDDSHIIPESFLAVLRDLKCWIKYDNSSLPELVKIKAVE